MCRAAVRPNAEGVDLCRLLRDAAAGERKLGVSHVQLLHSSGDNRGNEPTLPSLDRRQKLPFPPAGILSPVHPLPFIAISAFMPPPA